MISVIIPVYNSERSIKILLDQLMDVLRKMDVQYEILPVCDSSPDKVWDVLTQMAKDHQEIRPILLAKNAGQQQATLCGIQEANGEILFTIDDDLEFSPKDIPLLYETYASNDVDIIYGTPPEKKHKWLKRQCSTIARGIIRFINPKLQHVESFRLIRSSAIPDIDKRKPFFLDFEIINRSTKVAITSVSHQPRMFGTSNYSALGSLHLWFTFLFKYSKLPLLGVVILSTLLWGVPFWWAKAAFAISIVALIIGQLYFLQSRITGYEIKTRL